jgi:hypothetical protein
MPKAKSITNTNKRKPNKKNKKSKKINKKNKLFIGGNDMNNNNNNVNDNDNNNDNNNDDNNDNNTIDSMNNGNNKKNYAQQLLDTNKPKMTISYRYAGVEFITINKEFEINKPDIELYEMQNIPYIKLSQELLQNIDNGSKYVLVMYDNNSYVSHELLNQYKNKTPPYYLHMVVEYTKEHKYGIIKLNYVPPTPPDNSGPHNYIFQLYKLNDDKKLNDNKLSIIENDKLKRSIHSEEHNHLDYLLVLLGLSTGDQPVESVTFKVNTNNNQQLLPSSNSNSNSNIISSPPPLEVPQTPILQDPLPAPEVQSQDNVKRINLGGEQQITNMVEPDQPNEVNDRVLDSMAESSDSNEYKSSDEKQDTLDSNEENDIDN